MLCKRKNDFILFFMKLEDFNEYLKKNLIKYLNKYGYNFKNFYLYTSNKTKETFIKNVLNELKIKKIPREICQTIFDSNKDEVNFFFTPHEIKKMENMYDIKINV